MRAESLRSQSRFGADAVAEVSGYCSMSAAAHVQVAIYGSSLAVTVLAILGWTVKT